MKTIILLSLILICNFGNAQNVNIPDANFKNYLVNNSLININSDSEIQVSEANAYMGNVLVNSLNISDLTGIEAFTNIIMLQFENNQVSNVNLNFNTNLRTLNCGANLLTTLDLSANAALTNLSCHNNQISTLDLSSNVNLTYLRCFSNSMSTLDFTPLVNLTQIFGGFNSFTAIDLSAHGQLTDVYFNNCSLTSLNVANGNNTAIANLYVQGNSALTCIQHDSGFNPVSVTTWVKDATASWNVNCGVTTSLYEVHESQINIYPNPTNDYITINTNNLKEVLIYNHIGNLVISSSSNNIDLTRLPSGMYTVRVILENEELTRKIIKH